MSYLEAAPWMESFEFKEIDRYALKKRSSKRLDEARWRLVRCLDLFDEIEDRHPEGSLRDELVRACGMTTGEERERCLTLLRDKIERKIGEALVC